MTRGWIACIAVLLQLVFAVGSVSGGTPNYHDLFGLCAVCGHGDSIILYVDSAAIGTNDGSCWVDAFPCLQDALEAAEEGTQIWVASGTYKPDQGANQVEGNRAATFMLKACVQIYGGFEGGESDLLDRNWRTHSTILSGDIGTAGLTADNSYHVVTSNGSNTRARLDGFVITAGNAADASNESGAGFYSVDGRPVVINCTFHENSAEQGGAVFTASLGVATFLNCSFFGNSADTGGAICNMGSSDDPTLVNCVFSGNRSLETGGAIHNADGDLILANCSFSKNDAGSEAGGLWNADGASVEFTVPSSGETRIRAAKLSLRRYPTKREDRSGSGSTVWRAGQETTRVWATMDWIRFSPARWVQTPKLERPTMI